jgi:predicted pyridoxine 5'-phosphate oxidase superfamily flavin-nucleotide-binding protein
MNDACLSTVTQRGPTAGVFHIGEKQAQALAGFSSSAAAIRDYMPEQHRTFFAGLEFMMLATVDETGAPLATVVARDAGKAALLASPDERTLRVDTAIDIDDPVLSRLRAGSEVGMLGIDFRTRRRNRANGIVNVIGDDFFDINVLQSFGNCPKYIHVRDVVVKPRASSVAVTPRLLARLDDAAREAIGAASTIFVATASGHHVAAGGVDISHRGGEPGFVKVEGDTLMVPDYLGNRYFNTLGNMLLEPRAALLLIDFRNGDLYHLQGRTEIQWQSQRLAEFKAAERLWLFHVEKGTRRAMGQLIEV